MKKINKKSLIIISFIIMAFGLSVLGLKVLKTYSMPEILTFQVNNMQSLTSALSEDGDKKIIFTQSFDITETLYLSGDITFTSSANVVLNRASNFTADVFEIKENAEIIFSQTDNFVLTLDGNNISCEGILFKNNKNASLKLLSGLTIKNFNSISSGTVVFNYGYLIIDGANIYQNKMTADADKYGIIHNYTGSTLEIKSGNIYENSTTQTGIIFINNQSKLQYSGGKIYSNQTNSHGGAFYIKSAEANFLGGEIYGNSAESNGGAIYLNDNAIATIDGTQIYNNTAGQYGAGAYLTGSSQLTLNSGKIKNNTSAKSGAGLFVTSSSKFVMNGGEISENQNESGNGGAFVNKSKTYINGGKISLNTAVSKGGAIYNDSGSLYVKNVEITKNTAGKYGGAICNESGYVEISSGIFTENTSDDDGGAFCGYSSSETKILGGTFQNNSASDRGDDIYGAGASTSEYSTITLTGGNFENINIQYCLLELGGGVEVKNNITFNAGKKKNYAIINIVSELKNKIKIASHSSVVAEDLDTSVKFLKYTATDIYSNIYRTARNIEFTNESLYTAVEGNVILVKSGENRINISADECVINAPLSANENDVISFSSFDEYEISNVEIKAEDNTTVDLTYSGGVYSFVMPNKSVSINYVYSLKPLVLNVENSIIDLIQVDSSYNYKDEVIVTILSNEFKKITSLYINSDSESSKLDIIDNKASFKMFKGATLSGEVKYYHNISFKQNELITNIQLNSEKQNKGLDGEVITFNLTVAQANQASRYVLKSVYYMNGDTKVEIQKNSNLQYQFTMPAYDVYFQYEFVDIFESISGVKVSVETETELKNALLNGSKTIIVCDNIMLTETMIVGEGEYTLISLGDNIISRSNGLKTNMFEIGFKSTLNLSMDSEIVGNIQIIGSEQVNDVVGSAFYVYDSGFLNIYKNATIKNHKLSSVNFIYSQFGKGNNFAGGSAIYNFNGIVNMYGGEICENFSTTNGSAIYNHGRFNLYNGSIHSNQGLDNGTIYNIRVFNQEGGVIENNINNTYGGAVYNANTYYAYAYILGGEIKNNTALLSGGAFYVGEKGVLWCKGGKISNNSAVNNGGGVNAKGTLFVTGTKFEGNTSGSKGGAIYGYCKPVFIRGGIFIENTSKSGGAIAINDGVELEISAGEFKNNHATKRGGAIYLAGDKESSDVTVATITGGSIFENTATEGSAICIQYAVAKIGGNVEINGVVETVSNPTQNYGYIEFIEEIIHTINLKPNKLVEDYQNEIYNVIRIKENISAEEISEKIVIVDQGYFVKVVNNEIYIYKIV